MSKQIRVFSLGILLLVPALSLAADGGVKGVKGDPAKVSLEVTPEVAAGGEARVVVRLTPTEGIRINRYPKIKLKVPGTEGLVAAAEAAVGNPEPPPPDRIEANYFQTVDPLELALRVDSRAPAGNHTVPATLLYYYCVKASGYCAPARVALKIPLNVR